MVKLRDNGTEKTENFDLEESLSKVIEGSQKNLSQLEDLIAQVEQVTRNKAIAIGASARSKIAIALASGLAEGLSATEEDDYASIFARLQANLTLPEQKRAAYALGNIAGRSPLEILPGEEDEQTP